MSIQIKKSVNFGSRKGSLSTVGYTLYNADGTVKQARMISGVAEVIPGIGIYAAQITFDADWNGVLVWDTGEATPLYAAEDFNYLQYTVTALSDQAFGSATFDVTTNVGKVRALTGDTTIANAMLSDAEINVFLSLESNDIYLASAMALRRIAADKSKLAKSITAGDYKEDLSKVGASLLQIAQKYEDRVNNEPADAQAEEIYTDFNYNAILMNKALRGEYD